MPSESHGNAARLDERSARDERDGHPGGGVHLEHGGRAEVGDVQLARRAEGHPRRAHERWAGSQGDDGARPQVHAQQRAGVAAAARSVVGHDGLPGHDLAVGRMRERQEEQHAAHHRGGAIHTSASRSASSAENAWTTRGS